MGSAVADRKSDRKWSATDDQPAVHSGQKGRLYRRLLVMDPHAKSDLAQAISSAQTEQDYIAIAEMAQRLASHHPQDSVARARFSRIHAGAIKVIQELCTERERKGLLALSM